MVNQSTANDTSIADNVAKRVKPILPQVKATPSELHSAAPEVIDVDVDENDAPPIAKQNNEADLNALKKTWRSAVYSFFKLDAVTVQYHDEMSLTTICGNQWRIPKSHCNATSTAVERVFSQGRHLPHFTRNHLSPSSTRAFLCLGSWLRCDLVAPEDLTKIMKSLKKRKREDESVG
ncbi:hypothetical protein F4604DRAFT_1956882 [Suillus subluteus]|nr:hypothetical protein F4604DRAFT_1956882 [Suillus subluteus]